MSTQVLFASIFLLAKWEPELFNVGVRRHVGIETSTGISTTVAALSTYMYVTNKSEDIPHRSRLTLHIYNQVLTLSPSRRRGHSNAGVGVGVGVGWRVVYICTTKLNLSAKKPFRKACTLPTNMNDFLLKKVPSQICSHCVLAACAAGEFVCRHTA